MDAINYEDSQGYKKCLCIDFIEDPGSLRPVAAVIVGETFEPLVMTKPVRGRSNVNLMNVILRTLVSCSDTPSYNTVPSRQAHKLSRNRETLMLAAVISSKVEARNFRAAV